MATSTSGTNVISRLSTNLDAADCDPDLDVVAGNIVGGIAGGPGLVSAMVEL